MNWALLIVNLMERRTKNLQEEVGQAKFMNQICLEANQTAYPFILPALPFSSDSLEPYMSAKTFSFHHQQHHNTYVNNLNKLLENN